VADEIRRIGSVDEPEACLVEIVGNVGVVVTCRALLRLRLRYLPNAVHFKELTRNPSIAIENNGGWENFQSAT